MTAVHTNFRSLCRLIVAIWLYICQCKGNSAENNNGFKGVEWSRDGAQQNDHLAAFGEFAAAFTKRKAFPSTSNSALRNAISGHDAPGSKEVFSLAGASGSPDPDKSNSIPAFTGRKSFRSTSPPPAQKHDGMERVALPQDTAAAVAGAALGSADRKTSLPSSTRGAYFRGDGEGSAAFNMADNDNKWLMGMSETVRFVTFCLLVLAGRFMLHRMLRAISRWKTASSFREQKKKKLQLQQGKAKQLGDALSTRTQSKPRVCAETATSPRFPEARHSPREGATERGPFSEVAEVHIRRPPLPPPQPWEGHHCLQASNCSTPLGPHRPVLPDKVPLKHTSSSRPVGVRRSQSHSGILKSPSSCFSTTSSSGNVADIETIASSITSAPPLDKIPSAVGRPGSSSRRSCSTGGCSTSDSGFIAVERRSFSPATAIAATAVVVKACELAASIQSESALDIYRPHVNQDGNDDQQTYGSSYPVQPASSSIETTRSAHSQVALFMRQPPQVFEMAHIAFMHQQVAQQQERLVQQTNQLLQKQNMILLQNQQFEERRLVECSKFADIMQEGIHGVTSALRDVNSSVLVLNQGVKNLNDGISDVTGLLQFLSTGKTLAEQRVWATTALHFGTMVMWAVAFVSSIWWGRWRLALGYCAEASELKAPGFCYSSEYSTDAPSSSWGFLSGLGWMTGTLGKGNLFSNIVGSVWGRLSSSLRPAWLTMATCVAKEMGLHLLGFLALYCFRRVTLAGDLGYAFLFHMLVMGVAWGYLGAHIMKLMGGSWAVWLPVFWLWCIALCLLHAVPLRRSLWRIVVPFVVALLMPVLLGSLPFMDRMMGTQFALAAWFRYAVKALDEMMGWQTSLFMP